MFESVDFIEFKGIKKCEKPIDLARFTLLIGPNNAGKTSVLEGLFFLPIPWRPHNLPFLNRSKLDIFTQIHGAYRSLVYRYSGKASILTKLEGKKVELKGTPNGEFKVIIEGKEVVPDSIFSVATALRGASSDKIEDELLKYTVFIPNNSQFINDLRDALKFY